jgi:hypothetical protein
MQKSYPLRDREIQNKEYAMENWTAQLTRSNANDIAALLRKYLDGKRIRPIKVWDDLDDFEPTIEKVTRLVEGQNKVDVIRADSARITHLLIYLEGEEPLVFSTSLMGSDESDANHVVPVFCFKEGIVTIIYRDTGNYIRHLLIPMGDIVKPVPATPAKPSKKKKTTKSKK